VDVGFGVSPSSLVSLSFSGTDTLGSGDRGLSSSPRSLISLSSLRIGKRGCLPFGPLLAFMVTAGTHAGGVSFSISISFFREPLYLACFDTLFFCCDEFGVGHRHRHYRLRRMRKDCFCIPAYCAVSWRVSGGVPRLEIPKGCEPSAGP